MTIPNLEQQSTIWSTALKNEGKAQFKYKIDREIKCYMIPLGNKSKKTHKGG